MAARKSRKKPAKKAAKKAAKKSTKNPARKPARKPTKSPARKPARKPTGNAGKRGREKTKSGPIGIVVGLTAEDQPLAKRAAAAIVLGELGDSSAPVIDALGALLRQELAALQRPAVEAIANLGAGATVLEDLLPLLGSRDAEVRRAASEAVATAGASVVPKLKARLVEAPPPERRAIEGILSRLGGKAAFGLLLERIREDPEGARAVAATLRKQVESADARERRTYRAQAEAFLTEHGGDPNAATAVATAVKVLGLLEDAATLPMLVSLVRSEDHRPMVRTEAALALRFALGLPKKQRSKAVDALARAMVAHDRTLAQSAMLTLDAAPFDGTVAEAFGAAARHADITRANLAIRKLGNEDDAGAAEVLAELVARGDRQRSELAADALQARFEEGADPAPLLAPLIAAFSDIGHPERATRIRGLVRPHLGLLDAKGKRALRKAAVQGVLDDARGWRDAMRLAFEADPKGTAKALREEVAKARKGRKKERESALLAALTREHAATPEEQLRVAVLALAQSKLDTRPAMRERDHALQLLDALDQAGVEVAKALVKERSVELEQLYYVGFHFAEEGATLGEELLEHVAKKAGRKKIGKAAKNKLRLMGD